MSQSRRSTWCSLRALGPVRRCAIIYRGGGFCAWCRCALTQGTAEIDHVVPRKLKGKATNDNLVPTCSDCNLIRPDVPGDLAQLSEPLDMWAGLQLALVYYSEWMIARYRRALERKRLARRKAKEAREEAVKAGLGGAAFPFGHVA